MSYVLVIFVQQIFVCLFIYPQRFYL
ncbi:hypothetical protein CY0110_17857 [Crocosphaera chwakensis CCY0110]|uniref:Uncharacterized protein n=1 Tax=Crocosphaera chwakensis CCY0110 TaxID=391612 RepID=A3IIQ3_9CHRO|nr:hypothetical protein CY0110_17857 [Crocosphaera chwakensis CCY0110]